jgi:hypothetical protein
MIRALLAFIGALAASAAVSGPCPAQQGTHDAPIRGVLSTPALVERSVAFTVCPSSAGGNPDETDVGPLTTVLTKVCSVERTDVLGEGDGVQWTAVRYITRYVYPADSVKRHYVPKDTTDTTEVLDVVLYSSRGRDSLRAEWQSWVDRRITRDLIPTMAPRASGALFSILSCVNGTGGCQQHFVLRATGAWVAVTEPYYADLARRFGPNPFWKGVVVDVRTLRGTVGLYSNRDSNCCPSRQLHLTLALRGRVMMVVEDHVTATAPP